MKKSTNTNWFTLVELIIVITILAILATIAFISFQSYTKDARDASKKSEIANIVKVIAAKEAKEGVEVTTYVKDMGTIATGNGVQGNVAQAHTWMLNTEVLGINNSKYANTYEIAVYTGTLNVYQIRTKIENLEENEGEEYYVLGTYNPRTSTLTGATSNAGSGITLTDGIGLAKVWDNLGGAFGTIESISNGGAELKMSGDTNGFATFSYAEPKSLFE